ncbi:hypothetical protein N7E81_11480 [Reichenbachiella carrageenanivorans]|uniref:Uncharacterized protein n=1 Tax=Reichenbachiella carrageenanivorans TaxID=2979869 RepID=A0ABY6CVP6_9BACT|nr:hypothetical protein [Reichenbachiella carrageenanivorans]UXX77981.1 hypothetical protein N7E81_11480 [Reichenbachiella carrageenanivorans]
MKIRINGNFVRLRLSQSEVTQFGETGQVGDAIQFGQRSLTYRLASNNDAEVSVNFDGENITVSVPKALADDWIQTELVGFENADQSNVRILVEKDFQCLHKRSGEDESDNFPNPAA